MNSVKPEQVGCSSERLKRIGVVMQRYINEDKIAGIQAMVVRSGQEVYSKCFGMMDIEADKPMQPDTLFRIYSMTKPITSVAVMMLCEEGHFQLTDPVSRFIPGFKDVQVLVNATESGLELANLEREMTIWHGNVWVGWRGKYNFLDRSQGRIDRFIDAPVYAQQYVPGRA